MVRAAGVTGNAGLSRRGARVAAGRPDADVPVLRGGARVGGPVPAGVGTAARRALEDRAPDAAAQSPQRELIERPTRGRHDEHVGRELARGGAQRLSPGRPFEHTELGRAGGEERRRMLAVLGGTLAHHAIPHQTRGPFDGAAAPGGTRYGDADDGQMALGAGQPGRISERLLALGRGDRLDNDTRKPLSAHQASNPSVS